ncbi:hypothetical protein Slin15195_G067570 [Septoria linicola]|uniref:Transmembrane protein n=1 Tax=Septoria linicola TaxID=215465 RepID=A0A9Q9AUH9_9PEZI|nr:hypothetical protein Slin14017_G100290 [Septoria linicola]USW53438.1 hypothetical protein Slin15195_G067570 [Septoria linicola]
MESIRSSAVAVFSSIESQFSVALDPAQRSSAVEEAISYESLKSADPAAASAFLASLTSSALGALTSVLEPSATLQTDTVSAATRSDAESTDPSAAVESALSRLSVAAAQPTTSGGGTTSNNVESTSQAATPSSSSGLTTGAIAAIAVCVTLAVVLCAAIGWFVVRRRRNKRPQLQQGRPPMQQNFVVPQMDGNPVSELHANPKPYEMAGNGVSELYAPPGPPAELHGNDVNDVRPPRGAW